MKLSTSFKVIVNLLFGILIVGCTFGPSPEMQRLDATTDRLLARRDNIKHRDSLWYSKLSKYKKDMQDWERDVSLFNKKEIDFIKNLNTNQLKIYAEYEEAINNNNLAMTELSSRKLKETLSEKQQNELSELLRVATSLEERKITLSKTQRELTEEKTKITNDSIENEKEIDRIVAYLSSQLGTPYAPSYSFQNSAQQSLQEYKRFLYQQEQRLQSLSINRSLADIASAIRGY